MCTACHVTRFAARCSRRMRPLAVATVPAAVEVGDGLARAGAAAGSGVWRLCRGARRDLARRSVHFSLGPNSWQRGLVSAPSVCRRCRRTRLCSRSAADPRAPARRRHWAGAPRLLHLDFLLAWLAQQVQDPAHHTWRSRPSCRFRSTARARLPTYAAYVARERLVYAGAQHRATSRSSTSSSRPRSGRPPSVTRSAIQSRHRRSTVSSIQFHHWGRAGNYSTSTTTQSKFGGDLAALMRELEEKDPQQDTLTKRRHGAAQHGR